MSRKRKRGLSATEEELDEWMCRAMNPDGHVHVVLPSGWTAKVAPDVSREALLALDRLATLAGEQYRREKEQIHGNGHDHADG